MNHVLGATIWGAVGVAIVYTLLAVTVGVSFYRLTPVDNDALTNALLVSANSRG